MCVMMAMSSGFSRCSRVFFKVSIHVPPTNRLDVLALSYHSWLDMAAYFSFYCSYRILLLTNSEQSAEEEAYDETDLKRNVYLLS